MSRYPVIGSWHVFIVSVLFRQVLLTVCREPDGKISQPAVRPFSEPVFLKTPPDAFDIPVRLEAIGSVRT